MLPASLASDPRDAGRDTTFCGGIIMSTTLSFPSFGPSLLHNPPRIHGWQCLYTPFLVLQHSGERTVRLV